MTIAIPTHFDWKAALASSDPLVEDVAPPPALEYLLYLDALTRAAATTPYASQGLVMDPSLAGGTYWFWGHVHGPASYALRGAFARAGDDDQTSTMPKTQAWSASGNRIDTPSPMPAGADTYPPKDGCDIAHQADEWDAAGVAGDDRLFELVSGTPVLNPTVEYFYGTNLHAFAGEVRQKKDLGAL